MFHPLSQTDSQTLVFAGADVTPLGTVSASTMMLITSNNYTITLPQSFSSHSNAINIMVNNSNYVQMMWSPQAAYVRDYRDNASHTITASTFTANWVQVGTIAASSITSAVVNFPSRYVRLQGLDVALANFKAYLFTEKNIGSY